MRSGPFGAQKGFSRWLPGSLLAYIDPMSGSIVLQALIAGVISVIAFFRRPLVKLFCAKTPEPAKPEEVQPVQQRKAA